MAKNALMVDGEMRPAPRNALMGLVADALSAVSNYANRPDKTMPMGKANPPLALLANALGLGDVAATADRVSFGHDLTRGKGMATQMLPETAGAAVTLGPLAAKFPKQAMVTAGLLGGPVDAGAMRAATVWHGSPHKFDKFDASKIGTGEGAQAYGHGLYLAENPATAESYASMGRVKAWDVRPENGKWAAYIERAHEPGVAKKLGVFDNPALANNAAEVFRRNEAKLVYKVDLPDSAISRMLDWDKPLSQQAPAVRAAIQRTRSMLPPNAMDDLGGDLSLLYGRDVGADSFLGTMNSLQPNLGESLLRKAGVPGVRYLDGGSRGAGAGTSNFVVFPGEENLLTILERNGKPLR